MTRKPREDNLVDIQQRYLTGESLEKLATEYHIGQGWLKNWFIAQGVPTRGRTESMRLRMRRIGYTGRKALTSAAQDARRGSHDSPEKIENALRTRAQNLEKRRSFETEAERQLNQALQERGIHAIPQKATLDAYNIDLAIGTVAVEVWSGHQSPINEARQRFRTINLLNAGWRVFWVWPFHREVIDCKAVAKKLEALIQLTERYPTTWSKCWMIRSRGEASEISFDCYHGAFVPPAINLSDSPRPSDRIAWKTINGIR